MCRERRGTSSWHLGKPVGSAAFLAGTPGFLSARACRCGGGSAGRAEDFAGSTPAHRKAAPSLHRSSPPSGRTCGRARSQRPSPMPRAEPPPLRQAPRRPLQFRQVRFAQLVPRDPAKQPHRRRVPLHVLLGLPWASRPGAAAPSGSSARSRSSASGRARGRRSRSCAKASEPSSSSPTPAGSSNDTDTAPHARPTWQRRRRLRHNEQGRDVSKEPGPLKGLFSRSGSAARPCCRHLPVRSW